MVRNSNWTITTILVYIILFIAFCIEYLLHYRFVNGVCPNLNEKQKSYILSIKSSLAMLLVGIYFNYHYLTSKLDPTSFFDNLSNLGSIDFGKIVLLYFTAYLVMDIYIGSREYSDQMKSLSGYFHHTVYTLINLLALNIGIFPMYFLHMLSELPTLILSVGSFNSNLRDDNLFGITFFFTRILYHIFLTYVFRHNTIVLSLSLATLGMHIYWFSGWVKKYFLAPKEPISEKEQIPKVTKVTKKKKSKKINKTNKTIN